MKIAVYGTLKQGHGNHRLLSHFPKEKDAVIDGYKLFYCCGDSGFPVAHPCESGKAIVEIYDIGNDAYVLRSLDALEGYREHAPETSMYIRTQVTTECGEVVYMYVGNEAYWNFHDMIETTQSDGEYSWP